MNSKSEGELMLEEATLLQERAEVIVAISKLLEPLTFQQRTTIISWLFFEDLMELHRHVTEHMRIEQTRLTEKSESIDERAEKEIHAN